MPTVLPLVRTADNEREVAADFLYVHLVLNLPYGVFFDYF